MTINKVAALKAGDNILVGDKVYTVTGTHQTGIHDLDVYVKSEVDKYESKLEMFAGDRVCVLKYLSVGE